MLRQIFLFEINYRAKRPATWIYFVIMFLMAFLAIAVDELTVGGGTGQVKDNAPTVLTSMMLILSALPGFLIISAMMGTPVLRDYEHKTESIIFTTPIRKFDYLMGRFLGSFFYVVLIFFGMVLGFMLGASMPWLDPERMLSFQAMHYLQPFVVFVLPGIFFSSVLFFAGGALSKNILFVYVQGIALLALYIISVNLGRELDNRSLMALLDPVGITTQNVVTQYWTVTEQNTQTIPFSGLVASNRLLWLGVGLLAAFFTYFRFTFTQIKKSRRKARKTSLSPASQLSYAGVNIPLPQVHLQENFQTQLKRVWHLSRLYFTEVVKSVPFIAITLIGFTILIMNSLNMGSMYGADTYPTTYQILGLLSSFNLFFIILIVFYVGELVWKERDIKMNQIFDAMPAPGFVALVSKFLGMVYVYVMLLLGLMVVGMLIQTFKGYFEYEVGVYLSTLFTETLTFLILYTLLVLFIQSVVNHKFLGHAVVILFFIVSDVVFDQIGLEHNLFQFASSGLGIYSDMNAYGHYTTPFSWFSVYWFAFGMVLFSLAVVFTVRGTDRVLATRLKLAKQRFARPILIFSMVAVMLFVVSGTYIYYNTNVLNTYRNSDDIEALQAKYEKELKQYQDIPQPRIVATGLKVDVFPEDRDFTVDGHYVLKNKTPEAISNIHIQYSSSQEMEVEKLTFSRLDSLGEGETVLEQSFPDFRYFIYKLDRPLLPGDSLRMDFAGRFQTIGFVESGSNTSVVYNGTFFNNGFFPELGYDRGRELSDEDDRKKQGLGKRERMRERDDPIGQKIPLVGDDADKIRFEVVVSTSPDQIALSPGYLQREWEENGRRYFHYKMDKTMFNFYNIVSARYEVMKETWTTPYGEDISLEIYYHPGHEYNLDRMMEAMKHSLSYYSKNFSPYQFRQMRIMEFPRYESFAQSFANTVPFSEGIGFILNIGEGDVDMPYYVTAHEMAHQWWGHQVTEANVKGNAMLSESLSQYSALMVMKEKYPPEMMQKFLRYELDRYLRGRASETKKEQPLALVESQSYIHYRKGSLVMYALQDYIGEDSVNMALKRYLQAWANREDRYPTTADLLPYFEEVTPDSLKYLIRDYFETITLYENRAMEPSYEKQSDESYLVEVPVKAMKYRADSLGNESEIAMSDWIDIGVYTESAGGEDSLLYLQKHKITEPEMTFAIEVDALPSKAGIDPLFKLIDRNPSDNVSRVIEK